MWACINHFMSDTSFTFFPDSQAHQFYSNVSWLCPLHPDYRRDISIQQYSYYTLLGTCYMYMQSIHCWLLLVYRLVQVPIVAGQALKGTTAMRYPHDYRAPNRQESQWLTHHFSLPTHFILGCCWLCTCIHKCLVNIQICFCICTFLCQ